MPSTDLIPRPRPWDPYQFPYTLTLRHFLVRYKMGSLFPIEVINSVCEDIYNRWPAFRTLRLPYSVWKKLIDREMRLAYRR